ncbi:right-handed parallel beta-helix repeat-containing protein [Methanobacterium paludis]|uniref:Cell surface glycoprotein (S-layer protein) n=1 Tax=Methanobacterium paludis (strain DSM 25820 / JCM 18151 / SWAN1) TaxID=868131 RepID=F6D2F7_METPW|nr:hypothetical protein [Methanobacterium paludis]AEG17314.1 cell surface glycoprotein (s-layer protein) [Methanobacterium paludis]
MMIKLARNHKIITYMLPLIGLLFAFSFCMGPVAAADNVTNNSSTNSTNWYVYSNQTIQDAVNNAAPGDTIIVNEGTYNENVILDKTDLTVKTNGNVTVQAANPSQPCFTLNSNATNAVIEGFTIIGSNNAGIYLNNTSNCLFKLFNFRKHNI